MTIRTVPPQTYIPPTSSEIKAMARQVGVSKYSKSVVEDLCNVQAGGDFVSNTELQRRLTKEMPQLTKALSRASDGDYRYKGEWLKDANDCYVSDKNEAYELVAKQQASYHQKIQDFVRTLDFSNVPGYTPLEKAMGLLRLLSTQGGSTPPNDAEDEVGDSLPIFSDNTEERKDPIEMANRLNEVMENVFSLDEHEKILCNVGCGDGVLSLAEDMLDGRDIMLQIKRELDKVCALQTSKKSILKPDTNGAKVRYRAIKNISEFSRLHPAEFMYPETYKNYRLVNGVSQVRERCTEHEKKMLLYIICDCSGSMGGDRFLKAGGVVMNRLKAVLEGTADCWLTFFHNRLGEEYRASSENVSEVRKLMSHIKASNFDAGGTSIAKCVREAVVRIEKKKKQDPKLINPELLVITDGEDDTTSLKVNDLGRIRLHTVMVDGHNQHLLNISRQSGGVGISRI